RAPILLHCYPTRRSSDLGLTEFTTTLHTARAALGNDGHAGVDGAILRHDVEVDMKERTAHGVNEEVANHHRMLGLAKFELEDLRSEEHTSELHSRAKLVC